MRAAMAQETARVSNHRAVDEAGAAVLRRPRSPRLTQLRVITVLEPQVCHPGWGFSDKALDGVRAQP